MTESEKKHILKQIESNTRVINSMLASAHCDMFEVFELRQENQRLLETLEPPAKEENKNAQ